MPLPHQATYTLASTNDDTAPPSAALTGTWTCSAGQKALKGTNGAATTEVKPGYWIYDPTNKTVAQIVDVPNDNLIYLRKALPNAQTGATLKRVETTGCKALGFTSVGGNTVVKDPNNNSSTFADGKGLNVPVPVGQTTGPYHLDPASSVIITYEL